MEAESGDINDGNFRALIRYRGKYDEVFKNDITSAGRNAQYLSPRVQNEILSACNDLILERLVDYINRSSFFLQFWLMKQLTSHVRNSYLYVLVLLVTTSQSKNIFLNLFL